MPAILTPDQVTALRAYIRGNPKATGYIVARQFGISTNTAYRHMNAVKAGIPRFSVITPPAPTPVTPPATTAPTAPTAPSKIDRERALLDEVRPPSPLDVLVGLLKREHELSHAITALHAQITEIKDKRVPAAQRALKAVQDRIKDHFAENKALVAGLEAIKRRGVEALETVESEDETRRRAMEWRRMEQEALRDA